MQLIVTTCFHVYLKIDINYNDDNKEFRHRNVHTRAGGQWVVVAVQVANCGTVDVQINFP